MDNNTIGEQKIDAILSDEPVLADFLHSLLRVEHDDLGAYLGQVACNVAINNTDAYAYCYIISLDGNKRPRTKDFARFLTNRIVDFAIPRSEIANAINKQISGGSTAALLSLQKKAAKLFTKLSKSGEGGEVLLSTLTEAYLQYPQLFTKMNLKTNPQMHIHGSDGVHVTVNEITGNLALYWGESKLYSKVSDAVKACFSSIAPFLLDSGGSVAPQERDLQLMREGIDFDNEQFENAIKKYLDPDDPMFNRLEYRGLCLIGFNSDLYPSKPNSKEMQAIIAEARKEFELQKSIIERRIIQEKIETFRIELFFLPFPNVDEFRMAFKNELGL